MKKTLENHEFLRCCAEEIKRIWIQFGGSMAIVNFKGKCPECGHFIGLTQTSKKEADEFLELFGLRDEIKTKLYRPKDLEWCIPAIQMTEYEYLSSIKPLTTDQKRMQEEYDRPGYKVKFPGSVDYWIPELVFLNAFQEVESNNAQDVEEQKQNLNFSQALEALRSGKTVYRKRWQLFNLFLMYFNPFVSEEKQDPMKFEKGLLLCTKVESEVRVITGWQPTANDIFAEDYVSLNKFTMDEQKTNLSFGQAIEALKSGKRVSREGWNGKNMWLALTIGSEITTEEARVGAVKARADELKSFHQESCNIKILPHIDMKSAIGDIVIGWLASQTDMLSNDWCILD